MKDRVRQILREDIIREERVQMNIPIPDDIRQIKDIVVKNGHKLFVVGGAVRDSILNKPIKDYDLATDATPDKVEAMMQQAGLKTLPTGKAFGVINVFTDSDEYEIATFRKDIGSGRRPDSVEFTTIDQDVKRRDLTINALFFDIDTGEVVDLVGGIDDLKKGIVRTVGSPEERFGEDRLRILRAIRFAGRFGSGVDSAVDAALKKDNSLEGISPERIRDEFLKGIRTAKSTRHFLTLIDRYNLWDGIFPGIKVNKKFIESKDPIEVIATLMLGNDPSTLSKQLNKLTYSAAENKAITFLMVFSKFDDLNDVFKMKKLQNKSGITKDQLTSFNQENRILPSSVLNAFLGFDLSVTGKQVEDVMGIKPGPEMGQAIEKLEIENFKKLL